MERPRKRLSSRYQLGMDFGQRPLEPTEDEIFRFTYQVKETEALPIADGRAVQRCSP